MELSPVLWNKALLVYREMIRREEQPSRSKFAKALETTEQIARALLFAIENRHVIRFEPEEFEVANETALIFNDVHIPFEDKLAVESMLSFAEQKNITKIVINGDLIDFFKISRFNPNPKQKDVSTEIKLVKEFLTNLTKRFPKAKIIYKEGNHEVRLRDYIIRNAPKIYDLVEHLYEDKLGLTELGIEYREKPFKLGKLNILHGHEKPGGAYNPEYICNVMWKYVHEHFVVGHFHRNQTKTFKNISGDQFHTAAIGYLAGDMDYAILNNWNQGFAIVDFQPNGYFKARLFKIDSGIVY